MGQLLRLSYPGAGLTNIDPLARLTMGPRRSSRGPVALSAAPRPVVGVRWGLVYGLAKGRAPLMHKFWAPSTNKRTRDKGRGRRWLTARSRDRLAREDACDEGPWSPLLHCNERERRSRVPWAARR